MVARLRDVFLLEGPLDRVRALTPGRQATIRASYDKALRLTSVADQLTDDHSAVAALVLYSHALPSLVDAVAASRDPAFNAHAANGSPWEVLSDLATRGIIPSLWASLENARTILAHPLEFEALTADDLLVKRSRVEAAFRSLRCLVEPRSVPELVRSRAVRSGVATAVVVGALGWLTWSAASTPNVALHKPVTVNAPNPQSTAPFDNSGFTNGEIEPSYGVHTALGISWVLVDLQAVYKISEIKIFNRGDGWYDGGLPFTMELSDDAIHFAEISRRVQSFSAANPWVEKPKGKRGRYVRIRSNTYVALAEIEVYGKR